jgi:hypothetical protein
VVVVVVDSSAGASVAWYGAPLYRPLGWLSDSAGVVSAVAGSVPAVVGGVVVAVVGGVVVAVGRVVAVVDGGVVDGGVVDGDVDGGVGDDESVVPPAPFGSVVPLLSPEELLPDGSLRDLWRLFPDLSPDLFADWLSVDVVVALAASAGGWAAGAGTARATPPPTDRPATIKSAPAQASA